MRDGENTVREERRHLLLGNEWRFFVSARHCSLWKFPFGWPCPARGSAVSSPHSWFPRNGGCFMNKSRVICICALAAAFAIAGAAQVYSQDKQDKKDAGEAHKIVHFGDLKWTPIMKGCDLATVDGDMNAEGTPFVLRIRCIDGSKIPAHWHPTDENVTVLKGTFLVG